ncbi:MAG: hypothetical protein RIS45_1508 [Planctomycetota bacterium]
MTATSAATIRDMTPAEAWEGFVGDQAPVEFIKLGGSTAHYVENAPLCEGLTIAAQSILRIRLDTYIERELNAHAERNPVPRMTEAAALALHPDAPARNIRAMIAGEDDASCPACGARLCWGDRRSDNTALAHCVRGSLANLGLMACDWTGHVRIFEDNTKVVVAS